MILNIILLIIGLTLLSKGADFFVDGSGALAAKFKIPSIIIGLTIVAIGTSAPEAAVSIGSAIKGANGVAIGNILGSNIANIFLILGATSAICPLLIKKNTIKYEIPFVLFITLLLSFIGYYYGNISRLSSVILLILLIIFFLYLFKISKEVDNFELKTKSMGMIKIILYIIGGLAALIYGSDLTVNSAIDIAHRFNISDRIIGLTIIAIGTSLPELITCIVAAIKKQPDIAIGNIIGSNIFNILFVLGVTGVIKPIEFDKAFLFDGIIAILSVVLLYLFTKRTNLLKRWQGVFFLCLYFSYLAMLIIK